MLGITQSTIEEIKAQLCEYAAILGIGYRITFWVKPDSPNPCCCQVQVSLPKQDGDTRLKELFADLPVEVLGEDLGPYWGSSLDETKRVKGKDFQSFSWLTLEYLAYSELLKTLVVLREALGLAKKLELSKPADTGLL